MTTQAVPRVPPSHRYRRPAVAGQVRAAPTSGPDARRHRPLPPMPADCRSCHWPSSRRDSVASRARDCRKGLDGRHRSHSRAHLRRRTWRGTWPRSVSATVTGAWPSCTAPRARSAACPSRSPRWSPNRHVRGGHGLLAAGLTAVCHVCYGVVRQRPRGGRALRGLPVARGSGPMLSVFAAVMLRGEQPGCRAGSGRCWSWWACCSSGCAVGGHRVRRCRRLARPRRDRSAAPADRLRYRADRNRGDRDLVIEG